MDFTVEDRPRGSRKRQRADVEALREALRQTSITGRAIFIPANGKSVLDLRGNLMGRSYRGVLLAEGLSFHTSLAKDHNGLFAWTEKL